MKHIQILWLSENLYKSINGTSINPSPEFNKISWNNLENVSFKDDNSNERPNDLTTLYKVSLEKNKNFFIKFTLMKMKSHFFKNN